MHRIGGLLTGDLPMKAAAKDYALTDRESALFLNLHITTFCKKVVEGQLPAPFFLPGPRGPPMWWKSALTKKTSAVSDAA
jgi:hypothetical protein